jgi:hypothetical protein
VITNSRRATLGYDQRVEVHGSTVSLRDGRRVDVGEVEAALG